ncbi:MAG TPA: aminomethyl-transferring glycine dehydrogenase subunit GcvPA, partial [Terriglobia bacterium]|nr:aminomethyl-transferring glycine dehydrogenase subunit GcvPA [Terriglobia bacterium]
TSYTPYQAEISQGTLTAIFEFQTLMCQLTGQEVANASMYDGSTALTEAVLMAERITGRHRVLVARSVHPEYRQVLRTYAKNLGLSVEEIAYGEAGQLKHEALTGAKLDDVAALVVQSPNFFGVIEDVAALAELAHASGALLVTSVAEAMSLGIVRPPAEADIVALEGQSFGIAPSYGGPFLGVIASREKYVRQMPGRLAGQTVDAQGRRGFVLTLATREQHIRREKATSNICTSQSLMALNATIYLCLLGKTGLRQLAAQNLAKAQYAAAELGKVPGASIPFSAPHFNEFVVKAPGDAEELLAGLREEKIIGGLHLDRFYPELKDHLLVCVTETVPKSALDRMIEVWHRFGEPATSGKVSGVMVGYSP